MKKLASILFLSLVIGLPVFAQNADTVDMKSMSKKERKEYKEKVAIEQKKLIVLLLNSRSWVLEATSLQVRSGDTFQLQPSINFVGLSQEKAVVQLGSSFILGDNGVGGITLEGKPSKYIVNEGKKPTSPVTLNMIVSGNSIGTADIYMTINASGVATANVTSMQGDRLKYRGNFKSLAESRVFKGTTTY